MDNLDEVSKALNESLVESADGGSSFHYIFETSITSDNPRIRQATVEALHETLSAGCEEQKNLILTHAGLTFIPLLISHRRTSSESYIPELVSIIASRSPPKEVIFSLVECLSRLEDDAQVEVDESEDESGEDLPPADRVESLGLVLSCFSLAIPRLRTDRSTPTLLSISDPLIDTFTVIAPFTTSTTAPSLLQALCEMISVTWIWGQTTSDTSGEQKAILTNLLFMAITLLSSKLGARLVERLFVHLHPRYGGLHATTQQEWRAAQRALETASSLAFTLGVNPPDLVHRLTHPSSISPYSSLAALALLVASLPGIGTDQSTSNPLEPSLSTLTSETNAVASGSGTGTGRAAIDVTPHLLEDSMPVLSAALSADALDAGLAWTWFLVEQGVQVSYETATLLLELLVPPSVSSPLPMIRMAIIKLVARLIDLVNDPQDQAKLFLQLAEPENPFEGVRVQSITMLRDAISKPSSPLLQHFDIFAPTLFTLPTSTISPTLSSFAPSTAIPGIDVPPLQLPVEALLSSMWISWFIETVNLLRLVLTLDKDDKSGLKSAPRLKTIYREWVVPQRSKVAELRRGSSLSPHSQTAEPDVHSGSGEVDFVLNRWNDALDRLCEEIRGILGDEMDQISGPGLSSIEE